MRKNPRIQIFSKKYGAVFEKQFKYKIDVQLLLDNKDNIYIPDGP